MAERKKRGRPATPRPEGWSAAEVLEWLRDNPQGQIGAFLERVADAGGITAKLLKKDIQEWKRRDPEFQAEYSRLMAERRTPRGGGRQLLELTEGMEDWKVRWAIAYLELRSIPKACREVGVSVSHVYNLTRRGSSVFDQELAGLREQVESALLAHAEEAVWEALSIAREDGDAFVTAKVALDILQRLDKARWSQQQTVEHRGSVEHHHHVHIERREAAMLEAAKLSERLFREPPKRLSAPPVTLDADFRVLEPEEEERHVAAGR